MHNLKEIRKDLDTFKKKINERNINFNFDDLVELDKINREYIQKKERLEQEKKTLSKSKDEKNFKKSKELSVDIDKILKEQKEIQKKINNSLANLPNISLNDVPVGKDEASNKIIKKEGKTKDFNFKIKSHFELGEINGQMDFKTSSKLSGSRFVILKDKLALLERALIKFMIDTHTNKFQYKEISPPLIVNDNVMFQ